MSAIKQPRSTLRQLSNLLSKLVPTTLFLFNSGFLSPEPASAQQIHWPRKELVIPFQVHQQSNPPHWVELEVSSDSGNSWTSVGKNQTTSADNPSANNTSAHSRDRQFQFQAPSDGEFWFRIKPLDRQGNLIDQPGEPMRIVVDSQKPSGELLIDLDRKGDLQAEFRILDSTLDHASVRLEYQTDLDTAWKDIPCNTQRGNLENEWIGSASWSIPHQATQLIVRLNGKDHAGNTLELTRMPKLPKTAQALVGSMRFASSKQPPASPPNSNSSPIIGSGVAKPNIAAAPIPPQNESTPKNDLNLGAPTGKTSLLFPNPQTSNPSKTNTNATLPPMSIAPPKMFTSTGLPVRLIEDKPNEANPLDSSQNKNNVNEVTRSELPTISPPLNRLDTAVIKPMHSSSKAFDLDYSIVNDPGAPIASVELWGTLDQGKTWERWGTDEDRESPFEIEVETDGLFGFSMVIVGSNGLASRRPLPGTLADAWIQVDTNTPRVRILTALAGKGPEAGSLVIEYQAIDDHFIDRPINLFFCETPQGPWTPITQGAKNAGRFVWAGDTHLPEKVFLKLQATDAAGNVGEHVLDLPVDVQSAAPRGKIQGLRPR